MGCAFCVSRSEGSAHATHHPPGALQHTGAGCLPGSVLCRDGKDSMASEQNYRVTFIATYEDGRQLLFPVDKFTMTEGDYAARIIACERQKAGELPPGKIMSVARSLTPSP